MTISKRLKLKLLVIVGSTFVGHSSAVPVMETSQRSSVVAAKKRVENCKDLKYVSTSGQRTQVGALLAAVCSEGALTVQDASLWSEMASNAVPVRALVEGTRYWDSEQRRTAM